MNRLTTNKEVTEMNMYELAHNSCYAKEGNARYRDFENDFDARELTIKLLEKYANIPNEFTCDEDFDDFILDALQYGTDSILGLIAVFYQHLWAMADLRETLKKYEDLEERGKIKKLPCAAGDKVYFLENGKISFNCVVQIHIAEEIEYACFDCFGRCFSVGDIGKTVFLTKEAAEKALKEMEGKK